MHILSSRSLDRPRTTPSRPRRRRQVVMAAVLATGLLLSACGGTDDRPTAPDVLPETPTPAPDPAPAPIPDPLPAPAPDATVEVAVHLVRSAPTEFYVEPVQLRIDDVGDAVAARVAAAIEALLGVTTPEDADLSTSVPQGTTLRGVILDGEVATLDLSGAIVGSSGGSSQERTFAQQLAHTARVDPSITAILLAIDGAPVTELWGHLDWSSPVEPDPFALSPITITEPAYGQSVAVGEVTFRGEATVFEATLRVELLDDTGRIVEDGFVTATAGGPERGTWSWRVTLPAAGRYTLVAFEDDPSGGEGRPPFETTRTIRAAG